MKIAILSPFYPYRGGIAQFSAMLYNELSKTHKVRAFSFSRLYPDSLFPGKTQLLEDKHDSSRIPSVQILDSINPLSYLLTALAIKRFRPDVLIIVYWMSFFAPAYITIANQLKKQCLVVALLHNVIPHEPHFFDKLLAKYFFKQCSGFVVMSEIVQKDLLSLNPEAYYVFESHPIYTHFGEKLPVDIAKTRLGLDTRKKTLLFFGLIRDYKGLDLLIEAMSYSDDSYELLVAGESYGSFRKYEELINQSPARDRIRVLNQYIDDSKVHILFSAADVLVLPYKSATQSGVLSVAYYYEIPVVATDTGGLKAAIERAGTGIICVPEAFSIASGIEELFRIGTKQIKLNIQKEKQNLSWKNFADSLIKFVENIKNGIVL